MEKDKLDQKCEHFTTTLTFWEILPSWTAKECGIKITLHLLRTEFRIEIMIHSSKIHAKITFRVLLDKQVCLFRVAPTLVIHRHARKALQNPTRMNINSILQMHEVCFVQEAE
jgi:hypothetical protein